MTISQLVGLSIMLVAAVLLVMPLVVVLLMVLGRGVPKAVHKPRLGWAAVGIYLLLCLIMLRWLAGGDDEDGDAMAIVSFLSGAPWSYLISWPLQALRRSSNLYSINPLPSEWWDALFSIGLAASAGLNCLTAYQLGKRLPVIRAARHAPPPPPLLPDLIGRPLVRRGVLIAGAVALAGYGWWYANRPIPDQQLIAAFHTNRAVFDQLVQMYIADNRDVLIDVDGDYRLRPAYPAPEGPGYPAPERLDANGKPFPAPLASVDPGYPAPAPTAAPAPLDAQTEARRAEYVALLRRAGLTKIWPSTLNQGLYGGIGFSRDYPGPHRIVRLVVSPRKMFIYAQQPLRLATDQGIFPGQDSPPLEQGLLPGGGLTTRCSRIESQWYLCTSLAYGD
jgi:hypothetical protein